MTDPEPDASVDGSAEPEGPGDGETPEEKRARVMARLAEIIRSDPPPLSGGAVSAGAFPVLPSTADEFNQEKAAELFAALGQFFETRTRRSGAGEAAEEAPEGD